MSACDKFSTPPAELKPLSSEPLVHAGNYPDGSTFWVAAPGVTPIAMTEERVDVLQAISNGMFEKYGLRPRNAVVIDEMLAEAQR